MSALPVLAVVAVIAAGIALWRSLSAKAPQDIAPLAKRVAALESRPIPRDPDSTVTIRD